MIQDPGSFSSWLSESPCSSALAEGARWRLKAFIGLEGVPSNSVHIPLVRPESELVSVATFKYKKSWAM